MQAPAAHGLQPLAAQGLQGLQLPAAHGLHGLHGLQAFAAAQGLAAASRGTRQLLIMPPPAQGLHGLQAPAAQGLQGLQPPAAHGLHGLQPPAAQGLQPLAAHRLHGLQPPAAHGLQGLQAASWIIEAPRRGTAVGLADCIGRGIAVGFAAPKPLDAAVLGPVPTMAIPTPAISGTTALDRSLVFNARIIFFSLVVSQTARFVRPSSADFAGPASRSKIPTVGPPLESLVVTYS